MMGIKMFALTGNVGRAPSMVKKGQYDAAEVPVAVTTHKDGPTAWVKLVFFGAAAERAMTLQKGELITFVGAPRYTESTDKNGATRGYWEVTVNIDGWERVERQAPKAPAPSVAAAPAASRPASGATDDLSF